MKHTSVTQIALVTPGDMQWRSRGRQHARASLTYGRDKRTNAYDRLSGRCERIIRAIIDTDTGARAPDATRRILRYRERSSSIQYLRFRELDAVIFDRDEPTPTHLIETKMSIHDRTERACAQVERARAVAAIRWPELTGVGIWVDASCLVDDVRVRALPNTSPRELVDVITRATGSEPVAVRVELEALLVHARHLELLTEPVDELLATARHAHRNRANANTPRGYTEPGFEAGSSPFASLRNIG